MHKKPMLFVLVVSLTVNILLAAYIISEQKYKSIQFQSYRLDYARCDTDSMTTNAEAYKAWKENPTKPTC